MLILDKIPRALQNLCVTNAPSTQYLSGAFSTPPIFLARRIGQFTTFFRRNNLTQPLKQAKLFHNFMTNTRLLCGQLNHSYSLILHL